MCNVTWRCVHATNFAVENSKYYISDCVSVPLVISHAVHIHHIIFSAVACWALPNFDTLCHKWHYSWGGGY